MRPSLQESMSLLTFGRAREIKSRLNTNRGFQKLLNAREFRKAARSAYQYAKVTFTCNLLCRVSYYSHHSLQQKDTRTLPVFLMYRIQMPLTP